MTATELIELAHQKFWNFRSRNYDNHPSGIVFNCEDWKVIRDSVELSINIDIQENGCKLFGIDVIRTMDIERGIILIAN